jgi:AraC-like DNA-binding protein
MCIPEKGGTMSNYSTPALNDSHHYEDLDIKIVKFEKNDVPPDWTLEKTISEACILTYIVDGRAVYYLDDKPFLLNKGDFIYIPAGVSYTAHADRRERLTGYTMIFKYTYMDGGSKKLPFPTVFNVTPSTMLSHLYEQLDKIWEGRARGYRLMVKAIALQIFHDLIFRTSQGYNSCNQSNRIEIIKNYIQKNYQKDIQLDDVAGILNLNPVYIGSFFKKRTGYSIRQYINLVRISQAKRLLVSGMYSVSEVAYLCGYHDIYYFSKVFKQLEGVSPSYYQI